MPESFRSSKTIWYHWPTDHHQFAPSSKWWEYLTLNGCNRKLYWRKMLINVNGTESNLVNNWLLINAKWAICQRYHSENWATFDGRGRCGNDRILVGCTTTCAISAYHHQRCELESRTGEMYSIQHYVIKFVSDVRQVRFPPPGKLTATI
jgi:hypothetical protein